MIPKFTVSQKIVFWSIGIVILLFVVYSAGSVILVRNKLTHELTDRLEKEAVDISRSLSFLDGRVSITQEIEWEESHHTSDEGTPIYIVIVNPNKVELHRSENCYAKNIPVLLFNYDLNRSMSSIMAIADKKWSFVTSPVNFEDDNYGWIIVGMSFDRINHIMAVMLRTYMTGLPIMILLAVIGSMILARGVIKPIKKMSTNARRIQAKYIHRRLPEPESRDEIRHLAQTLNRMLDRLENSINAITQFSANASHELKTPLAIINSRIEQLTDTVSSGNELAQREIKDEIRRMSQIIDDLAFLSRADSQHLAISSEEVWLNDVIYEELPRFKKMAVEKNIRVTNEELPAVMISGNEHWLRILAANLLENAIKYSPSDTVVSLGLDKDKSGSIDFWVADEGPGVPADELDLLTQRFYRSSNSHQKQGSGLGLSIAEWVAHAHGGELLFENKVPQGLCVTLQLPAEKIAG